MTFRKIFDLSDLLHYLWHHNVVSGIQRVQVELVREALTAPLDDSEFVFGLGGGEGFFLVNRDKLASILASLDCDEGVQIDLRGTVEQIRNERRPFHLEKGDDFLVLGAFWVLPDTAERLSEIKRSGARLISLIYDLIPISHPEFVESATGQRFIDEFEGVCRLSDVILTISDFVANEVRNYLLEQGISGKTVSALRLAHGKLPSKNRDSKGDLKPQVQALLQSPFVLFVSTIEARKNHAYLVSIWRRLLREHSNVPNLVFVGREGWRIGDLLEQLRDSRVLQGKVTIISDASDQDLSALYRNCMFTVFPSLVEGWGLPIGESLAYGKVCVASQSSSIPEVGGRFCRYVDPEDTGDGFRVISELLDKPDLLRQLESDIATSFVQRTWRDVSLELERIIDDARQAEPSSDLKSVVLSAGKMLWVGTRARHEGFLQSRLICGSSWYPAEGFGRWMRGREGRLRFSIAEGCRTEVIVALRLNTPPWYAGNVVEIRINGGSSVQSALPKGAESNVCARGSSTGSGEIDLSFTVLGHIEAGPDIRTLTIGLLGLAYAPVSDIDARLKLLEELTFQPASTHRLTNVV